MGFSMAKYLSSTARPMRLLAAGLARQSYCVPVFNKCPGRSAAFRLSLLLVAAFVTLFDFASPASAAVRASPAWSIQTVAQPTGFSSTDNARCEAESNRAGKRFKCDRYSVLITNRGTVASSGQITVTGVLPTGVTTAMTPGNERAWTCSEGAGQSQFVCTTEGTVSPLTAAIPIEVPVSVSSSAVGPLHSEIKVSGGGTVLSSHNQISNPLSAELEPFAINDFNASALNQAGELSTQAGSHPGSLTTDFEVPSAFSVDGEGDPATAHPVQFIKQIVAELPAGLIGDARATPTCPLSGINNHIEQLAECPPSTRVGSLVNIGASGLETELAIFNMTPEHGYAAEFAVFQPLLLRAEVLYASVVGSGADTHVRVSSGPQNWQGETVGISLAFFGDPAKIDEAPLTPVAFATNPSNCSAPGFTTKLYVDSWQNPGRNLPDGQPDLSDPNWKSASSSAPPVTGCEALQFHPTLSFAPEVEHGRADEPSGYSSTLRIPQNEDPNGLATPPLKDTVVTLPSGVAVSPAAADGLVGCQSVGGEGTELASNQPGHCPAASKVGEVEAVTPLLEEPLKGGVYVAQPGCSPCSEAQAEKGEVFALYLELGNEDAGVHIKVPGTVEVGGNGREGGKHNDLAPGQVRTTFAETPQQPVSELKLTFNGGPRAPLANPQTCGGFESTGQLEPWSHTPAPGEAQGTPNATLKPAFAIAGCESRFAPGFTAGTTNNRAGAYTPSTLTFSRQDREQDLSGVSVTMPAGLIGKVAGIAQCGEAQANAGSCSSASQVGTATGGAGSGSQPLYQSGPVYLTGPYKGAPFGLSIVVPAVAGPFNLGSIVVRAAISVNPVTAAITVVSDPLPQSVDGVPLRLKTVNVTVGSAGNFTFNPTSCTPSSITATLTSLQGTKANVSSPFDAANCASLAFKPTLSATTAGRATKPNGASLNVKVSYPSGPEGTYANIKSVKVDLPKQLPSRLTTLQKACLAATFEANPANCPTDSDVGTATAKTPLLNVPVTGPAYLVSHGGEAFPDLELVLQGEGVTLLLDGNTQIKKGITSSTFKAIPDAPVSSFELKLPTGKFSILGSNVPESAQFSLCGQSLSMPTAITAQNGIVIKQTTKIGVTGCPKTKAAKPKKKAKAAKSSNGRVEGRKS
jgi:hypothetical protein